MLLNRDLPQNGGAIKIMRGEVERPLKVLGTIKVSSGPLDHD